MRQGAWHTVVNVQFEMIDGKFTGWFRDKRELSSNGVWPEYRFVGPVRQVR